jgi:hypothetical protein
MDIVQISTPSCTNCERTCIRLSEDLCSIIKVVYIFILATLMSTQRYFIQLPAHGQLLTLFQNMSKMYMDTQGTYKLYF